jgi:2-iminobutanoate/2-iminopropanoate deaminase
MSKEIFITSDAPAPIGPYNQAVKAGNLLFISGQIALVPGTSDLMTSDIKEETKQVMNNLKAILTAAAGGFENVVKTTIFLSDMNLFGDVNEIYGSYFESAYPQEKQLR